MRKGLKYLAVGVGGSLALAAGAVGLLVYRQLAPPLPPPLATVGSIAVHPLGDASRPLSAFLQPSRVTVVSFWATWCVPCRSEAAALARLTRRYPRVSLDIAYLDIEEAPDPAAVAGLLRRADAGNLLPLVAGRAGWHAVTGSNVVSIPRAYVFDAAGRPIAAITGGGPAAADSLTAAIYSALGGDRRP